MARASSARHGSVPDTWPGGARRRSLTQCTHECPRLWRRLRRKPFSEPPLERGVDPQCPRTVSPPIEHGDKTRDTCLVVGAQLNRTPGTVHAPGEMTCRLQL